MPIGATSYSNQDSMKRSCQVAITRILEPLADLLMDSGITAQFACQVLRATIVRMAARRVHAESGRHSKSRVAAITGLSRSEVSRLWKSVGDISAVSEIADQPAIRVLGAWHKSTGYISESGDPEVLPIFGSRRSFQRLVESNSAGIPVRAMLDELVSLGSIEILPNQRVRVKSKIPIHKGFNAKSIDSIGTRSAQYLEMLIRNLGSENPLFEASTGLLALDSKSAALVRREVTNRATSFFSNIEQFLKGSEIDSRLRIEPRLPSFSAGIGIYYFENDGTLGPEVKASGFRRKNLRRSIVSKRKSNSN